LNAIKKGIWGPWATIGWGFLIFIVWNVFQAVPILVIWISYLCQNGGKDASILLKSLTENGNVLVSSAVLGGLIGIGLVFLIIWIRKGTNLPQYLALQPLKWKDILLTLGVSIPFFLGSDLLNDFLGKDIVLKWMIKTYSTCDSPFLLVLGIVFLGPLFEEFFFRGFLFEGLRNSKLGNIWAALLISAIWAFLHLQYDFYTVAIIFLEGLLLSWLRMKTGTLWSCILSHILNNTYSTVEIILYLKGYTLFHVSK